MLHTFTIFSFRSVEILSEVFVLRNPASYFMQTGRISKSPRPLDPFDKLGSIQPWQRLLRHILEQLLRQGNSASICQHGTPNGQLKPHCSRDQTIGCLASGKACLSRGCSNVCAKALISAAAMAVAWARQDQPCRSLRPRPIWHG